ncbi:MAG TPA: DUF6541 family protein [Mycobacterium sp.]|nr:DUF6541 family protein [Mycobacterium sp.]
MSLAFGVAIALLVLILPGTIIGVAARLSWPVAVAVGPALTYGAVGLAIVPFGAVGIPWNAWTALATVAVLAAAVAGLAAVLARRRDAETEPPATGAAQVVTVAAGVVLGAALIGWAAWRGIPHWQSIPSTWDAVWHANTVRFIIDTGQASPTHMGELRNVETHATLYYPSAFHALTAVLCQLTGAAPTTGCTLAALAASVWLFPVSAALLTRRLLRHRRPAAAAAAAAALSASFTALPYVEFGTGAMPNLAGYGIAVPAFVLVTSVPAHRDRIAIAVLALVGVFSVHLTGGVVTILLVAAWWLGAGLRHPVRGRGADLTALAAVAVPAALLLTPQLLSVSKQADIIAGHSFLTHEGRRSGLRDALLLHTRHLNDFPIQYALIGLAAVGAALLLAKKVWWPLALWAVLVVAIVHSSAPLGGPAGAAIGAFTDLFYNDPRRLAAMLTLLVAPTAGIGLAALVWLVVRLLPASARRPAIQGALATVLLVVLTVGLARHYLPRHRLLLGDKYDSVMIDERDLQAFAYLAALPGARDTVIGNANTDGTAWMYAVAGLHPLWTHYDYPVQQGPGPNRFIFWAYADDADTDPRVADAIRALNIRYVLISSPTVRGFTLPEGLLSLDKSQSWTRIYDNGGARIYEWRGDRAGNRG